MRASSALSVLAFAVLAASVAPVACTSGAEGRIAMPAPARMVYALTVGQVVSDLGARAELVTRSGERLPAVELARGADGVSFSGFVTADPGDYTLELVFSGVRSGMSARVFLGRYTSDAFTVSKGAAASPRFVRPLDTVGLASDGGDEDGDGFGLLDELLFGSDPASSDSDGDGISDGADCDPADLSRASMILPGGSVEDCDADGVRRPDLPFASGGTDCNDKDATVRPGADDDCTDAIDQDCNPATCPSDDRERPSISMMSPAEGATVGCQSAVRAVVRDNGNVASVQVDFADPAAGGRMTLFMTKVPGESDVWESEMFDNASGPDGLRTGQHRVTVRARDNSANEEAVERAYNFTFDKPQVTDIMPHELGVETAPFAVTVNASSVVGLASITLYRAPHSLSGGYAVANAIEVGSSATSPATFTVDPGALPDGEHILYAVVRDTAGNATLPPQTIFPIGGANGLTVDLTYRCIATTDRYTMPVRVLITGGASPFAPAKVREHLAEANMLAANADSGARLVSIIAFGLKADGTIALDDSNSYVKRIQYSYYNASSTHAVTVSWFTPAFMMNNPVVDPDAGNVSATDPIPDPALLADSDAIATAFDASPLCPALIGDEDDYVLYNVVDGAARANVYTRTNQYWVGTGTSPVTELTACQ